MIKTYPTHGILNSKQAHSLLMKLIYSMEGIADCKIDTRNQDIIIEALPDTSIESIDETVAYLMDKELHHRIISTRIYVESDKNVITYAGTSDGIDHLFASNGTVRRGLAVTLYEQLDRILMDLAVRHQAQLRYYPSMISIPTLQKCRYINSFPQNIHLVAEFPHQLKSLEMVRENHPLDDISRLSSYALSPAVCYHCYAELAETRLSQPLLLTALGTCYRHEATWRLGKHRLNEFKMREIVLFGEASFIASKRKEFMEEAWSLFQQLGFAGRIETATDPFYFSEENAKGQIQTMGNMKYELIVDTGELSGSFSIASFNNMQDSLCKPFGVTDDSFTPLHSGCIGFGMDRWVYALLAYYGNDYESWPIGVRNILEGR
jgi:seryl-tRNA synthetase